LERTQKRIYRVQPTVFKIQREGRWLQISQQIHMIGMGPMIPPTLGIGQIGNVTTT